MYIHITVDEMYIENFRNNGVINNHIDNFKIYHYVFLFVDFDSIQVLCSV